MQTGDVEDFAAKMIKKHKLKKWGFAWIRTKRIIGLCKYHKKEICFSRPFLYISTELQIKDIILHEIAHALVGPGHGHDDIWKAKAKEIGAIPKRFPEGIGVVPGKYVAVCKFCGYRWQAYRKMKIERYCNSFPACGKRALVWEKQH